jgi:hypothetical protein
MNYWRTVACIDAQSATFIFNFPPQPQLPFSAALLQLHSAKGIEVLGFSASRYKNLDGIEIGIFNSVEEAGHLKVNTRIITRRRDVVVVEAENLEAPELREIRGSSEITIAQESP